MSAVRFGVMLGTSPATRGGIAAVVAVYLQCGLLQRQRVRYLATHCDGSRGAKLWRALSAWVRFMGWLGTGRVEFVHVHFASRASFWRKLAFVLPAFAARRPVLLHLHGGGFRDFFEQECGRWAQATIRWTLTRAARVIVLSRAWCTWVHAICPHARPVVIHNPILVPPPGPPVARDPRRVLGLGRLGRQKGTFDLLDAVALAGKRGVGLYLVLGGDGDAAAVRAAADRLGLAGRVELLGWIGAGRKARELEHAGVFALPSYHEGLPMSLLEAMAAGLPVVTTAVGGIPDAVDDQVEGFLVAPGDVAGLAERLCRLTADPVRAAAMGQQGRARVQRSFTAEAILPQIEHLYEELRCAT